jgi:hypothetical protein
MRFLFPIGAVLAFGLAAPAHADVTARFSGDGKYGATISVGVDEAGQVRAEGGPPNQPEQRVVLITRAGIPYFSAADAHGRFVGRQDDMLSVTAEIMRGVIPAAARGALSQIAEARFEIVEGGIETVAGRQGRVYRLQAIVPPAPVPASAHGGDGTENPDAPPPPFEIVISEDPELAPVGREIARLFASGGPIAEAVLGRVPEAMEQVRALLARGTPIRIADRFRLRSVSPAPIPDSAFALPGPVLSRAELAARAPRPSLE